jgi:hypothetical protein
MKRIIAGTCIAAGLLLSGGAIASADATAPTNGGSANGNGSSGQCTGDMASRPPSCHNSTGVDGN